MSNGEMPDDDMPKYRRAESSRTLQKTNAHTGNHLTRILPNETILTSRKSCNFNKQTSNKMIRTYVHMPNKAKYLSNTRWSLTFFTMYAKLQLLRDVTIVLLGSDIVALLS